MGVLNRILAPALLLLLAACEEDENCRSHICPPRPDRPANLVGFSVEVGDVHSYDSVWIGIHSGPSVERGPLVTSWSPLSSSSPVKVFLPEGEYSGHAIYLRPGDTLDVYDADHSSIEEKTDECGCLIDWRFSEGHLDLRDR